MHKYLPAIGFKNIKKKSAFNQLTADIKKSSDGIKKIYNDEESSTMIIYKEVAPNIGLALCGEENSEGEFVMEYHYPYIKSDVISTTAECAVQRETNREAYDGVCDDIRLGLNLIFSLNNFSDYCKYKLLHGKEPVIESVCFSGLSVEGKIILPIAKQSKVKQAAARMKEEDRIRLLEAARDGNKSAIDSLAVDDMDMNIRINKLLADSDLYTVVESFIMPYGMECDLYSVMGEIVSLKQMVNKITSELMYVMDVLCNSVNIRIIINKSDLLGEPAVGRRFKGDIWLQGYANL